MACESACSVGREVQIKSNWVRLETVDWSQLSFFQADKKNKAAQRARNKWFILLTLFVHHCWIDSLWVDRSELFRVRGTCEAWCTSLPLCHSTQDLAATTKKSKEGKEREKKKRFTHGWREKASASCCTGCEWKIHSLSTWKCKCKEQEKTRQS